MTGLILFFCLICFSSVVLPICCYLLTCSIVSCVCCMVCLVLRIACKLPFEVNNIVNIKILLMSAVLLIVYVCPYHTSTSSVKMSKKSLFTVKVIHCIVLRVL